MSIVPCFVPCFGELMETTQLYLFNNLLFNFFYEKKHVVQTTKKKRMDNR